MCEETRTYLSCLVYHFESNQNMINIILKLEHFEVFLLFKWGLKWRREFKKDLLNSFTHKKRRRKIC